MEPKKTVQATNQKLNAAKRRRNTQKEGQGRVNRHTLITALKLAFQWIPVKKEVTEKQYPGDSKRLKEEIDTVNSTLSLLGYNPNTLYDEMNSGDRADTSKAVCKTKEGDKPLVKKDIVSALKIAFQWMPFPSEITKEQYEDNTQAFLKEVRYVHKVLKSLGHNAEELYYELNPRFETKASPEAIAKKFGLKVEDLVVAG